MFSGARQLRLPFPHEPGFAAADFMTATSNEAAVAWLARGQDWPDQRLLLWGEAGCGKTHLLHVWAARARARLLPGPSLAGLTFPAPGALAIDDADLADETALFHLLNAAREQCCAVLLTARQPPSRWRIALPDLGSRMRSLTAVEIGRAEDTLLRALLARLLADRQLAITAWLQDRLLLRLPRTPAALREAVAMIDADGRAIDQKLVDDIVRQIALPTSGPDAPGLPSPERDPCSQRRRGGEHAQQQGLVV